MMQFGCLSARVEHPLLLSEQRSTSIHHLLPRSAPKHQLKRVGFAKAWFSIQPICSHGFPLEKEKLSRQEGKLLFDYSTSQQGRVQSKGRSQMLLCNQLLKALLFGVQLQIASSEFKHPLDRCGNRKDSRDRTGPLKHSEISRAQIYVMMARQGGRGKLCHYNSCHTLTPLTCPRDKQKLPRPSPVTPKAGHKHGEHLARALWPYCGIKHLFARKPYCAHTASSPQASQPVQQSLSTEQNLSRAQGISPPPDSRATAYGKAA